MENLSVSMGIRMKKFLSNEFRAVPIEFIDDAIREADIIYTLNLYHGVIPLCVTQNPSVKYKYMLTTASRLLRSEVKLHAKTTSIEMFENILYRTDEPKFDTEKILRSMILGNIYKV